MNDIPAFPRPYSGATQYAQEGMTLRDYFAANAMQTILPLSNYATVAKNSYAIADAMMEAREQKHG